MSTETPKSNLSSKAEADFSFKEMLFTSVKDFLQMLTQWKLMLIFVVAGGLSGLIFSFIKSKTYTARLSFVVEDAKSGSGSLASAVAGQFGFDISSLAGNSGIIGGDNVLELLKSTRFIKETLLSFYNDSGASGQTLADQYADVYKLKNKWANDRAVNKRVSFWILRNRPSRTEDSLLQVMIERIAEKQLSVNKPDKKLDIFEIEATMKDEKLAKLFCERMLKNVTDFYIDTKTSRQKRNVERLQRRVDSIDMLLNRQTYISSEDYSKLIDANPVYTSPNVNAEISQRNKVVLSTIYTELVKNLEIGKTALIQETPTVQIIDSPELPLKVNRVKWYAGLISGCAGGFIIGIVFLSFFKKEIDAAALKQQQ